jgi:hypothetical protein
MTSGALLQLDADTWLGKRMVVVIRHVMGDHFLLVELIQSDDITADSEEIVLNVCETHVSKGARLSMMVDMVCTGPFELCRTV